MCTDDGVIMGPLTFNHYSSKEGNYASINSNMGLDGSFEATNAQKEVHSSSSLPYPPGFSPMHKAGGGDLHSHVQQGLENIKVKLAESKCLEVSEESLSFPPGFEPQRGPHENDIQNEDEDGGLINRKKKSESLIVVGDDDILEEAKKVWELRKMFGYSADNEINDIWASAKNRKDKKGKKNNSRGRNKGRKEAK